MPGEKNSASRPQEGSRGFLKRKEEMIGRAVGRRHVGHQSVKSEQSVGVGGGTFRSHATGHYRIKYRQAAFSDGESRARNREKNARIRSGFSPSLSLPLFPSFSFSLAFPSIRLRRNPVCPPTPAALIIGSAKLSPSNSSPTLPS